MGCWANAEAGWTCSGTMLFCYCASFPKATGRAAVEAGVELGTGMGQDLGWAPASEWALHTMHHPRREMSVKGEAGWGEWAAAEGLLVGGLVYETSVFCFGHVANMRRVRTKWRPVRAV